MIQASQSINIHVMHADSIMNAGIAAILAGQEGMRLSSCDHAPPRWSEDDVIVTDYEGGIHLGGAYGDRPGRPRILVLTQRNKEWAVRQAMDSGVHGYVLQNCMPEELVKAIRALQGGRRYLSAAMARCVAESVARASLTGRETDVLRLLGKGYCNKTIARELGIGLGTVKTHLKGVMTKLNATARTHAVVLANERGLLKTGASAEH